MGLTDSNLINTIVDSLNKVIYSTNPHLKGRLISVLDVDEESQTFKIMKRVKCVLYYYEPVERKKTPCLTVQEIIRMPEGEKDYLLKEFSKRFLTTVFMWTSSQNYNDLINGKFECESPSDSNRES